MAFPRALRFTPAFLLLTTAVSLASIAGCASGDSDPTRDAGGFDGARNDSMIPGSDVVCGTGGNACCAGRTCELGLRCGTGDLCCTQPGGPPCDSASDCCRGLACEAGNCCTPRGGA